MTIPLIKEPENMDLSFIVEKCHFCGEPTRYWHENTNNPVCKNCSKSHKVSELPDYGKMIRARKRDKSRNKAQTG